MPLQPLGTSTQWPDLNFADFGPGQRKRRQRSEAVLRAYVERQQRRRAERSGAEGLSGAEVDASVARLVALDRPMEEDEPRRRIKGHPVASSLVFTRRDGPTEVRYTNGLVELANLPDFDFDFRVRFELVETDQGPTLAPAAVAVIVRPEHLGKHRGGDFANAGLARAVKEAARVLTRRFEVGEDGRRVSDRAATGPEVERVFPRDDQPSRSRRASSLVDREARQVGELLQELRAANGAATPWRYAEKIAVAMKWTPDRQGLERVRKRKLRAEALMPHL